MPLELTDRGLLPPGIHNATVDEIGELFGQVQKSTRRPRLLDELRKFVDALKKAEIHGTLIVDGSFVMKTVDEPGDIDLILSLDSSWDLNAELNPYVYNLVSKRMVKKHFHFDLFVSPAPLEGDMVTFFEKINVKWFDLLGCDETTQKGLVRIAL